MGSGYGGNMGYGNSGSGYNAGYGSTYNSAYSGSYSPSYSSGYSAMKPYGNCLIPCNNWVKYWYFELTIQVRTEVTLEDPYHSNVGYGTKEINRGVTLILNSCIFISVFITILMFVSWQCHCDPSFKTVKWVIKANEIVIKLIVSLSII